MKKIYFVRHGESEGNASAIRQTGESPLSAKGQEQARFIAERCKSFPAEVIISSTMLRAHQTAICIQEAIQRPLELSDLFTERRRPSGVIGKSRKDPEVIAIEAASWDNFYVEGYRHSDEENMDDLKDRAREAMTLLEQRKEDTIIVVTHGFFVRVLAAYAIFGDDMTWRECARFAHSFHVQNTGISVLAYDERRPIYKWGLWIWNDHAHLGEIE